MEQCLGLDDANAAYNKSSLIFDLFVLKAGPTAIVVLVCGRLQTSLHRDDYVFWAWWKHAMTNEDAGFEARRAGDADPSRG